MLPTILFRFILSAETTPNNSDLILEVRLYSQTDVDVALIEVDETS
jgi:hypothetical protein